VLAEERRIVETRPEVLIVRVDRTDPSKNVVRGFRAFALLFQRYPELAGKVGMLALMDPSRQDLASYSEYLVAIQREARALNERFGTDGWQPIDLRVGDNFHRAVAAYKQFDVLLVNPIFDGMNLVAKEAPFVNERDGAVVLSENAGAHEDLGDWTITVNPFDIEGMAEGLHEAVTMPREERHRRSVELTKYVRENDVGTWANDQLDDLDRLCGAPSTD
jgi:trehalose 6-phosphate synthase